MPHYAAGLKGEKHLLEDIAPCFTTTPVTIRQHTIEWIMESSNFAQCQSHEELYESAKAVLIQIHQVLALYTGLYSAPFSINSTLILNDDDTIVQRRLYATLNVNIYSGAARTLNPTASGSIATTVLAQAADDPAITEALSLVGYEAPTWARIYDIIEFLGGERSIERLSFAPRRGETRRVRQTANYYRHLGNPNKFLLPLNPPTLPEAALFATGLLKKWIESRR
jgi:hypothetical protein